ncbi:MAG: hypothetical protein DHS20C10_07860 [marine bacterium B5-7]|nr:MAG: hypothetical protein DHS20C10_07860 [marine bacterium B5-7]
MDNNQILLDRLSAYHLKTQEDEENALKEILQEIALYALSTTDFFTQAQFHGGTSLRIFSNLPRFSEDLDFVLKQPSKQFEWEPYLEQIKQSFRLYGITPEITDRQNANATVKKCFLKDNSIGKILTLHFHHHARKKLCIKLEIDTNPPAGSQEMLQYLSFPIDFSVVTHDLSSNFAGKCHALLCRPYLKGRDWFDFVWYINQKTPVNLSLLGHALDQSGPWQDQHVKLTADWLCTALEEKIATISWPQAMLEVQRFVNHAYADSLNVWNRDFFMHKVTKLKALLSCRT